VDAGTAGETLLERDREVMSLHAAVDAAVRGDEQDNHAMRGIARLHSS
jgi:hypothetical protein